MAAIPPQKRGEKCSLQPRDFAETKQTSLKTVAEKQGGIVFGCFKTQLKRRAWRGEAMAEHMHYMNRLKNGPATRNNDGGNHFQTNIAPERGNQ